MPPFLTRNSDIFYDRALNKILNTKISMHSRKQHIKKKKTCKFKKKKTLKEVIIMYGYLYLSINIPHLKNVTYTVYNIDNLYPREKKK